MKAIQIILVVIGVLIAMYLGLLALAEIAKTFSFIAALLDSVFIYIIAVVTGLFAIRILYGWIDGEFK